MIVLRNKYFTGILNTKGVAGFNRYRKYDQDFNRLGRMNTAQRELHRVGDLNREIRKLNQELNQGRLGKWQSTD